MGNQSDLQKQVVRFRERAHLAEASLEQSNQILAGYGHALERAVMERGELQRQLTQARQMVIALAAVSGEAVEIPFSILEAIDNQELIGIDPERDEEAEVLIVRPVWAATDEEDAEDGADSMLSAENERSE